MFVRFGETLLLREAWCDSEMKTLFVVFLPALLQMSERAARGIQMVTVLQAKKPHKVWLLN